MEQETQKLTFVEKTGYAFGDADVSVDL